MASIQLNPIQFNNVLKRIPIVDETKFNEKYKNFIIRPIYKGITYSNKFVFATDGLLFVSGQIPYVPVFEGKTFSPVTKSLVAKREPIPIEDKELTLVNTCVDEYLSTASSTKTTISELSELLYSDDIYTNGERLLIQFANHEFYCSTIESFINIAKELNIPMDTEFLLSKRTLPQKGTIYVLIVKFDNLVILIGTCTEKELIDKEFHNIEHL